nr:hypothetical protein [Tanacetum cinerariifolium]
MCRQPLPPPLSSPSAKLMIMAFEEYGLRQSVGLDSRARGGGRMYSGHLEAKILWRFENTKLTTGRLVNGSSCGGIDMVIKKLDIEPKDIVAKFYGPCRWKELSKETSSKIFPCGDGSC